MEEKLKQIKSSCKRVVLYGPESTGKTTLAQKLSDHYNEPWVPEFARDYLQKIWDQEKRVCEPKDLLPIAKLIAAIAIFESSIECFSLRVSRISIIKAFFSFCKYNLLYYSYIFGFRKVLKRNKLINYLM